jgi:hypothetical protein
MEPIKNIFTKSLILLVNSKIFGTGQPAPILVPLQKTLEPAHKPWNKQQKIGTEHWNRIVTHTFRNHSLQLRC